MSLYKLLPLIDFILDSVGIKRVNGKLVGDDVCVFGVVRKHQTVLCLPDHVGQVDVPLNQLRVGLVRKA